MPSAWAGTCSRSIATKGSAGLRAGTAGRAFDALCKDTARRRLDMVMAWSVDRLGRSLQDLVGFLSELHALDIDLFLYQQGVDTTTPGGKALFQIMGVFAEFERAMIKERVKARLERAKAQGTKLGRRPIEAEKEAAIRADLLAAKAGIMKLAAAHGVGSGPFSGSRRRWRARGRPMRQPASTALRDSPAALRASRLPAQRDTHRGRPESSVSHLWPVGGSPGGRHRYRRRGQWLTARMDRSRFNCAPNPQSAICSIRLSVARGQAGLAEALCEC